MSNQCGSFHLELVSFLQKDARDRILREGFDPEFDPELGAFHQLATQFAISSEAVLPWDQIIDRYHAVFEGKSDLRLESDLYSAFSPKEAKEHALKVYRGLPRVYQMSSPSRSRIKKYFNYLPTLKRLASEKSVFRLYQDAPLAEGARLSFLTWAPGLDDYQAGLEIVEMLRERFSDLELNWIVLYPSEWRPLRIPQGCKTHLISYDGTITISQVEQEALEILRTSDFILQTPTCFPLFRQLKERVEQIPFSKKLPVWSSLGKYGSVESAWFHPRTRNRAMGLHFLEKGILIHRQKIHANGFELWENESLLKWLFETSFPMVEKIQTYQETHHFYFADLQSAVGGGVYLHALLTLHERDHKGIDICTPHLGWLFSYLDLQNQSGQPILAAEGVALEVYFQDKMTILKKGIKKLRIFCPGTLSQKDVDNLMELSGELVGVRGDALFSKVISANKGFFYDAGLDARYFMKDLLALAENRIGMHRSTLKVFRAMGEASAHHTVSEEQEWVEDTHFQEKTSWIEIAQKMGAALQDPDGVAGFKKLNRIIAEEHSLNDFLCFWIRRELYHYAHPESAVRENQSVSRFAFGECSLPALIADLRK